jgi:very-short-patch-repair endonuclease
MNITPSPLMGEGDHLNHFIPFAKKLRRDLTDTEDLLWKHLRAKRLGGYKFKWQEPIGR